MELEQILFIVLLGFIALGVTGYVVYDSIARRRFRKNLKPGDKVVYFDGIGMTTGTVRQVFSKRVAVEDESGVYTISKTEVLPKIAQDNG